MREGGQGGGLLRGQKEGGGGGGSGKNLGGGEGLVYNCRNKGILRKERGIMTMQKREASGKASL